MNIELIGAIRIESTVKRKKQKLLILTRFVAAHQLHICFGSFFFLPFFFSCFGLLLLLLLFCSILSLHPFDVWIRCGIFSAYTKCSKYPFLRFFYAMCSTTPHLCFAAERHHHFLCLLPIYPPFAIHNLLPAQFLSSAVVFVAVTELPRNTFTVLNPNVMCFDFVVRVFHFGRWDGG